MLRRRCPLIHAGRCTYHTHMAGLFFPRNTVIKIYLLSIRALKRSVINGLVAVRVEFTSPIPNRCNRTARHRSASSLATRDECEHPNLCGLAHHPGNSSGGEL